MKKNNRYLFVCLIWIFIALILSVISLHAGRFSSVSITDVIASLKDYLFTAGTADQANKSYSVVVFIRFPRTVAALMVGSSLAGAGVAYQALFSNPIASPDVLGVTQGSAFGAVLGILFGLSSLLIKISAFITGSIVVILVFLLAKRLSNGRNETFYLLLMGMIAASFFQSMVSLVKYTADADEKLPQITYWLLGSLSRVDISDLIPMIILFLLGTVPLISISWRMNLLILSPEEAQSMGISLPRLRTIIIICATLLTAVATAVAGCITWFGLLVPHLVRFYTGNDVKKVYTISICAGASLMLAMDIIARSMFINELPISILTSIIGMPLFLIILFKEWRNTSWN